MSMEITFPFKLVAVDTYSTYFAAHNPIIVSGQRKDFAIDYMIDPGDGLVHVGTVLDITGVDLSVVGDYVYVKSNSGGVTGVYKVIGVGTNEIIIDADATIMTPGSGGFINLNTRRGDYSVQVKTYKADPDDETILTLIATSNYTPDPTGLLEADISSHARRMLSSSDDFAFDELNKRDLNQSVHLKSDFSQSWTGISGDDIGTFVYYYWTAINAAMQPGNIGGSNMILFNPISSGAPLSKWLTTFSRPTYFAGYPFDLALIFSEILFNGNPVLKEHYYSEGGASIGTGGGTLDLAEGYFLNRINIAGGYTLPKKRIDVTIGSDDAAAVTEILSIDIEYCVPRNPLYIRWWNTRSGWNYWLFGINQTRNLTVQLGSVFNKFFSDVEDQTDTGKFIGKDATPEIVLGAGQLNNYKIAGLEPLLYATEVQILMNPNDWGDDGPVWQTARLKAFKYNNLNKHRVHTIEITLELLDIFTQTQ